MCEECVRYDDDYIDLELVYEDALGTIEDLHTGDWTPTRLEDGTALCKECGRWWPCQTFLLAVGAINYGR